ncbi:site-2 protease family protein [Candidatus Marinimicrobia bacterium]|nr:site-2 protease family protein [Candidatus Neomarinimicrobiota bacterium]
MLLNLDFEILVLLIPALVLSLCVHEYSHGIVAYYYGDDTAYRNGRLTLNPAKHLDPMGTLMLLFIGFGYAKPVPVNPFNLKNPRNDMIKVAAAGPISNILLAFAGIFTIYLLFNINPELISVSLKRFLQIFIQINIYLAIFNLIPMYPLDGGQIFGNLLSEKYPSFANNLKIYGPRFLLGIILFGLFSGFSIIGLILQPLYHLVYSILEFVVNIFFSILN